MKKASLIGLLVVAACARIGKWDVIKDAIGDTGRTIRLIAIIMAITLSTGATALVADLMTRR